MTEMSISAFLSYSLLLRAVFAPLHSNGRRCSPRFLLSFPSFLFINLRDSFVSPPVNRVSAVCSVSDLLVLLQRKKNEKK